ncbi:MAG TPA: FUSC family protein [Arthrobacter bacterium]|nr:FUSC family protein [Arthrobacter sp.]
MRQVFKHAKEVARIGPAQSDHLPALRVGLSVSVPLLVLLALGRPELSIYAVFGGFTAMYGRNDTYRPRLTHQGRAALLLTSGLAVGVLLSVARAQPWMLVIVESLFAVAGSLAADRMGLRPSGPFYAIFALGACASVPTTIPFWLAVGICAASAAFSIVVGVSGWVRNRTWSPAPAPEAMTADSARSRAVRVHAARYLIAVVIAGTLGVLGGAGHANWTMAAAAVPLAATNMKSRILRGIHRVIGTLAGILLTAVILLPEFDRTTLTVLLMVLLFPTELFMMRHYGLAMMFFTPAILLMSQLAYPISRHVLVTDRAIETLVGASIGMAVAILVREPKIGPRD